MALLMRARHEEDDGQLRTARVLCGQVHLQRAPLCAVLSTQGLRSRELMHYFHLFSWYSFIDDSVHATLESTGNANGLPDARCIDMMYLMKSALGAMTAGEMSQMYPILSIHYITHYTTHRATRIGPRFVGCQMIHITSNDNLFIATWPSPLPSWPCLLCKALKLSKNLPQAVLCIGRIDSWTC